MSGRFHSLIEWKDRLFARVFRRVAKSNMRKAVQADRHHVLLVAPVVDHLTGMMADWLKEVRSQLQEFTELIGSDISHQQFAAAVDSLPKSSVVIFYGHGSSDSLLTSAALGLADIEVPAPWGALCVADSFGEAPDVHLVALAQNFAPTAEAVRLWGSAAISDSSMETVSARRRSKHP
jgi:hypothetical protein